MSWSIKSFNGVENLTDAVTNTSSVTWQWTLETDAGSYDHTGKAWYRVYTSDGSYDTGRMTFKPGSASSKKTKSYTRTTQQFAHNSDGSLAPKQFNLEFYESANYKTRTASYIQSFTTYARYATITSFNVNKRDETSLNVTWSANVNCNAAWYRIRQSGGSYGGWISCGTNFNITGLSAGTTYIVQIRVRRADSGLTTDSGEIRQATYDYPYISTTPDFVIGNNFNLSLYNPLGRECTIYLKNPLDTELEVGTISTTILNIQDSQSLQTFLYDGIPNSQNGLYRVRLVCNTFSRDTIVNGGTYSVDSEINKPTFTGFTSHYAADLTNLTNNNQTVIDRASTITFTIDTNATAINSSTISHYDIIWGDVQDTITDISNSATLVKGSGDSITVVVYDSRGLSNTKQITFSELVIYNIPTNGQTTVHRLNGVESTTFMDLSGIIYYDKFGTNGISNSIKSISYSVQGGVQDQAISDISSITYSSQSSETKTQRFSISNVVIHANGTSGGFDINQSYIITITATDMANNTLVVSGTLQAGKFALDRYKDSSNDYHYGINGPADDDYALKVYGAIMGSNMVRMYMDSDNNLYITDDGSDPNPNT